MHYSIVAPKNDGAARILNETLAVFSTDKTMQADLRSLDRACCVAQKPAALEGAPLPVLVDNEGSCAC
jgi:hypothetical protein